MVFEVTLANAITVVALFVMGLWAVFKLAGKRQEQRLDQRFDALEAFNRAMQQTLTVRLDGMEGNRKEGDNRLAALERELLMHKAELPLHYVRREDYIRGQSVIESKLDGLALRIENQGLKGGRHD